MSTTVPARPESVFTYGAPALKFGPGASDETGFDLSRHGARRVPVIALMEGAMKQQRLLSTAPRAVTEDDLAAIFDRSLSLW